MKERTLILKKFISVILAFTCAFIMCFSAIPKASVNAAAKTYNISVELKKKAVKKTISIEKGSRIRLTGADGSKELKGKKLLYKSNKPKIAKVSKNGVITVKKEGTAKITVATKDNKKKAVLVLKGMKNVPVDNLTLNTDKIDLKVGESYTLTSTVEPETVSDPTVVYSSSHPDIADVSGGVVSAKAEGTAVIIATAGGKTAVCTVEVKAAGSDDDNVDPEPVPAEPVKVADIVLNATSKTITEGSTFTLIPKIAPANADNKFMMYSTSDSTVAVVNGLGKITAKSVGTAVITCTAADRGGAVAKCVITVKEPDKPVTDITLSSTALVMLLGSTETLSATVLPENADDKSVTWSSSKPAVATVINGLVTATNPGSATITCEANDGSGIYATCTVNVFSLVTSITLDIEYISRVNGSMYTIVPEILPENATDKSVIFSSSNENVARVNNEGLVTCVGVGEAIITCTAADGGGTRATSSLTVTEAEVHVTGVSLAEPTLNIYDDETVTLHATVEPANATNNTVRWGSDTPSVATINDSGVITPIGEGSAVITCATHDGGYTATCRVNVTRRIIPVTDINLSDSVLDITVGSTGTLTATVSPSNATDKTVTWDSRTATVATVTNGTVTGISPGRAIIACTTTDGGFVDFCVVNVTPILVTGVSIDQASSSSSQIHVVKGNTTTLTASVTPANATNRTVSWSSNNEAIATVDNTGIVTGNAVGSARITCAATDGSGKTATCNIVVDPIPVTSVSLPVDTLPMMPCETVTLGATILPAEAIDNTVTWTSSNNSVATVTNGVIEGHNKGTATITATAGGKSDSCVVTVGEYVTGISLDITSKKYVPGGEFQLTPTITPSTATVQSVAYVSSNTDVATVTEDGLVTCKRAGTATITCTALGSNTGVSAACDIEVLDDIKYYGTCGDGVLYEIYNIGAGNDTEYALRIYGYGAMSDFSGNTKPIWITDTDIKDKLTDVIVESGVKEIGAGSFYSCNQLERLQLSEGLQKIKREAFRDCKINHMLVIPSTVTVIGQYAFRSNKITKLTFANGNTNSNLIIEVGAFMFNKCISGSIRFPDRLTKIGEMAFYACVQSTDNGLVGISEVWFSANSRLQTLGQYAFSRCDKIETITLPRTLQNVGLDCFRQGASNVYKVSLRMINVRGTKDWYKNIGIEDDTIKPLDNSNESYEYVPITYNYTD